LFEQPLYRTGIAVGDYTIDHHHLKNPAAPAIDFVKIKVPSYNVPLGSLIPEKQDGLIIAEKSISVSNIVNGATRLQPVVLTIGQASGALAAIAIKNKVEPRNVNIREVQQALLQSKAYIMPFIDVKPEDQDFASIQRIGATGILEGVGISYKWANQTWFYPEREIVQKAQCMQFRFFKGLFSIRPALFNYIQINIIPALGPVDHVFIIGQTTVLHHLEAVIFRRRDRMAWRNAYICRSFGDRWEPPDACRFMG